MEAGFFQIVKKLGTAINTVVVVTIAYKLSDFGFIQRLVSETHLLRKKVIDKNAADTGFHHLTVNTHLYGGLKMNYARLISKDGVFPVRKNLAFTRGASFELSHIETAKKQVLIRNHDRHARGGLKQVLGRLHYLPGFGLGGGRQRNVHGHLVAVEVGVKRRTYQGVNLNGLTFDQDRFEGLETKSMKGGSAVKQNIMVARYLFQDIVHF